MSGTNATEQAPESTRARIREGLHNLLAPVKRKISRVSPEPESPPQSASQQPFGMAGLNTILNPRPHHTHPVFVHKFADAPAYRATTGGFVAACRRSSTPS